MQIHKIKSIILITSLVLTVGTVSAAEIEFGSGSDTEPLSEETVWMNHNQDQRSATLTCGTSTNLTEVKIEDDESNSRTFSGIDAGNWVLEFGPKDEQDTLKHEINEIGGYPADYTLSVLCGSGENQTEASATIKASELDNSDTGSKIIDDGKGLVGQDMIEDSYDNIEPIELDLVVEDGDIDNKISPSAENFEIEGNSINLDGDSDIEIVGGEDLGTKTTFKLTPSVVSFTDSTLDIDIYDNNGNYVDTLEMRPDIKPYSYTISESPKSKIDFENVLRGNYEYVTDIRKESSGEGGLLDSSDFGITIEQFGDNGFGPVDTSKKSLDETDFKQEEWLDWSPTSGNNENEYRIYIENMNYINELPDGLYRFELVLKKGSSEDKSIVMDRIQVDKGTVFSGKVQDSQGGGVPTNFFFDGERSIAFESRGDGSYSQEIKAGSFNYAELEFFDTGSNSYDSKVFVNKPDLSEKTDLGGTGESSVIFDYYTNPKTNLPGVDPVNMFSVKFGYSMGSVDRISTKFDASNINPENLQVFECGDWNFASEECNEEWSSAYNKGKDFTIDKSTLPYRANIKKVSLFTNPEDGKTILNNAYILGTAADIELKNEITVSGPSGGRIPAEENLTVSGGLVDEQENNLGKGHEVEIVFGERDLVLTPETDSNGDFEATGPAPSNTGEYKIKVSSSPEGYGSLSRTFEDPLVVFNKKDISVDVPRQFSLQRDKETDVDIGIDNTGQVNLEGVSLSFSGMDSSFYSVSEVSLGELSPGESTETTLSVEIPEAYSNAFPSLTVDVSAQAGGQEVTDSGEIQFQAQTSSTGSEQESSQNNETNQTGSSSQDEENVRNAANSGSGGGISWSAPSAPNLNNVTGQFMEDRSTLNMALGVITVFLMIVAVAVKKDKENGRGPAGMRNRPMSSSTGGAATSVNVSASSSSVENQEKFVHEETGKTFDTKEGLEMFEEMQS